jgi:1,2-diacylglycerol 3-alpha-glucosyltransferase
VLAHASLSEAQGRVLIEALSHGVPCVAHDSPVMRFALGDHALLGDFGIAGSLARLVTEQLGRDPAAAAESSHAGHAYVYERFSWDRLRPRYVELLAGLARANSTVSASTAENVSR